MTHRRAVTNLSRALRIKRRGFHMVLTLKDLACSKRNQLRFHVNLLLMIWLCTAKILTMMNMVT